jgi:ribonucleoside-diphosphate reductase alpha chain
MIRPEVLEGYTQRLETPCGDLYLTLNECENKLCEVRMILGKSGTCYNIVFQTIALLLSVMLQEGISKERIKEVLNKQFEGNCGQNIYHSGILYHSCIDFMVKKLLEDMASRGEIQLENEVSK